MASTSTRYIRGALAYYGAHRMRLLDAFGENVQKFELKPEMAGQHKGATGTDPRGWTPTVVEVGTGTSEAEASDEAGIAWELVSAANEDDGISLQKFGETFQPDGERDIYFGVKLEADEATQLDFLFGLAITDTALLGGLSDGIYFEKLDAGTGISGVTEKDSGETQTDDLHTFAANTPVILEFYYDGAQDRVYFFVDGLEVAIHTAGIPDDEALRISMELLAGSAAARRLKIHWMRCIQIS